MPINGTTTTTDRRAAIVALAVFTLTFALGGMLLGEVFGSSGDSDQTFIDHYASSRNRGGDMAGSALLILSGAALLVFVTAMRRLLASLDSLARDLFSQVGFAASMVLIVAATLFLTTPLSISFGGLFDDTEQFAGTHASVLPQAVAFAAMPLAAFAVVLVTIAARSRQMFPRWHTVLTWVCAALLLLAVSGVAGFVLPVWSAATAVALWRGQPPASAAGETGASTGSS